METPVPCLSVKSPLGLLCRVILFQMGRLVPGELAMEPAYVFHHQFAVMGLQNLAKLVMMETQAILIGVRLYAN